VYPFHKAVTACGLGVHSQAHPFYMADLKSTGFFKNPKVMHFITTTWLVRLFLSNIPCFNSSVEVLWASTDDWLWLKFFQISEFGSECQIWTFERTSTRSIYFLMSVPTYRTQVGRGRGVLTCGGSCGCAQRMTDFSSLIFTTVLLTNFCMLTLLSYLIKQTRDRSFPV